MNVVIPAGAFIGNNSIVSANTVVRKDIPENTLVYSANEYKSLHNVTTGFQFQ
jgi:acetyltransferase-like isoleucine patch superfamily enzyme